MLTILLALQGYSGLVDSIALRATADSFGVPQDVVFAIAWQETRSGKFWSTLGPGISNTTISPDGRVNHYRTCREQGRFQLKSCVAWERVLHDSRCTRTSIRSVYNIGVHCGVSNLARLYGIWGDWLKVIERQNGSGPKARKYLQEALAYIGWRRLRWK